MPSRDSQLWNALFTAGLAMSATFIVAEDPAAYGLTPVAFMWLKLFAFGIMAVGGKNSNSLVKDKDR